MLIGHRRHSGDFRFDCNTSAGGKEFPFDPKKGPLEAEGPGKKRKKIPAVPVAAEKEIIINLKFFTPKGPHAKARLKWKTAERKKWIKQTKWWVKNINNECKVKKIKGVKDAGRDKDTLPAETTEWAEDDGVLAASDPDKKRFFIGREALAERIGQNRNTRWFFIAIFRSVRIRPNVPGRAGSVPGLYIAPNMMAAKSNMVNLGNRRHELGHLMGLKHSDGGLMHKKYPPITASKKGNPVYGNAPGDLHRFRHAWCEKIAKHLNL